MRALTLTAILALLLGCKNEEPKDTSPRVHTIQLSSPSEVVEVSVGGRDDLKVSVFERDGRLVAAIIDHRTLSDGSLREIQRWEMLAKSNKEVALTTRKDFHWLKYVDASDKEPEEFEAGSKGFVLYCDADGDGVPDYLFSKGGRFKVSTIGYEKSETSVTSFDIHELPPVDPDETFPVSPSE